VVDYEGAEVHWLRELQRSHLDLSVSTRIGTELCRVSGTRFQPRAHRSDVSGYVLSFTQCVLKATGLTVSPNV
jgi:hypothetical protein